MRQLIRHSIDFALFSNGWVALSVATLVIGFAHYYCITDCYLYGAFAFLGTFATYNFHRMVRNRNFRQAAITTDRSAWLERRRIIVSILSVVAASVAAVIFFWLPIVPLSLFLLGGTGCIVFFYALPIPGLNRSLRQISGLKNVWIVLVWVVLIAVPPINRGKELEWIDLAHVSLFVFVQIIPFDIRDLHYDAPGMRTLPQIAGARNARLLATALLVLLTASLVLHHGFYPLVFLPVLVALAALWQKQDPRNLGVLELSWDGALLLFGIFYYFLPCHSS